MQNLSRAQPVLFIEEPLWIDGAQPHVRTMVDSRNLTILVPCLNSSLQPSLNSPGFHSPVMQELLHQALGPYLHGISTHLWYFSPLAVEYSAAWPRALTIYDCVRDVPLRGQADERFVQAEKSLLHSSDIVFTEDRDLFESLSRVHLNVHLIPNGIERELFLSAQHPTQEPLDQGQITGRKAGYAGPIDDHLDIWLIDAVAGLLPDWKFIFIGPLLLSGARTLPQRPNVHYLGEKPRADLPRYMGFWDAAVAPFVTTTGDRTAPSCIDDYLASGRPVIATPNLGVLSPYAELELVLIAADPDSFAEQISRSPDLIRDVEWRGKIKAFIHQASWEARTRWMGSLITSLLEDRLAP